MFVIILLLLVTGFLAGLIAGLFGLGGGILFTPVLLLLFQLAGIPDPVLWTLGTSLLCNFTAAVSSSFKHFQLGNIFLREGISVGVFGIAGTYIGRIIATSPYYNEFEFTIIFSMILLYSVFHFLKKKPSEIIKSREVKNMRIYQALVIGLAAGALATLAGVGGGLILVPVMTVLFSFGYRKVVSISSTAIIMITLAGWIQLALLNPETGSYTGLSVGFVDLGLAFPLIVAGFFGARYGVKLVNVIKMRTLERSFALLILLVVARLMYSLF